MLSLDLISASDKHGERRHVFTLLVLCHAERQDCDTDVLKDLLISSSAADSEPYKPDPQISVQFVQKGQYRVFNRTSVPFIYFEV